MALNWESTGGSTPLDEDERLGLITAWVTTREQLDEVEQHNIELGAQWGLGPRRQPAAVLQEAFVKRLHTRMYGEVWKWAGTFRRTEKNIGVDPLRIATDLRLLLDDAQFWIAHATYPPDEIAIRTKHRMVLIHCFANGNGRHSRLVADILAKAQGRPLFNWGHGSDPVHVRARYFDALHAAHRGDINPLIVFARS